jgi:NAD(P)H-dependent flavin oxidoreductase YrpB (nitropropane dioxygenase family)
VVPFVPEVASPLHELGQGDLHLIAAGGIGETGWAAGSLLEPPGLAIGTQYLGAEETSVLAIYRCAIFEAFD